MRKLATAAVVLGLAVGAAAPAFAGPIGSGLWLTEQVARERAQEVAAVKKAAALAEAEAAKAAAQAAVAAKPAA